MSLKVGGRSRKTYNYQYIDDILRIWACLKSPRKILFLEKKESQSLNLGKLPY